VLEFLIIQFARNDDALQVLALRWSDPNTEQMRVGDQRCRTAVVDQVLELVGLGQWIHD
jgi:hypothetical protein